MKVINKKTGRVVVFPEGVWNTIVSRGDKGKYKELDPVPQPKIRDVEQQPQAEAKPKKGRKKKDTINIVDITNENTNLNEETNG